MSDDVPVKEPEPQPAATAPRPRQQRARLTEDELQNLVDDVTSGRRDLKKVDPQQLPDLITALKNDRDNKICHRKRDEAEVSDRYLHFARQRYNEWQREHAQQIREAEVTERYKRAKKDLADLKAQFELEEVKLREENEQKQQELLERQEAELEQLREQWRQPEKERAFNRTSGQLRALRKQAILLLNDHRYSEMRQVQKLADKQEAYETDQNYRLMEAHYMYAQQLLARKHEAELETLLHAQDVKLSEHECKAKIAMLHAQRRVNNRKNELDDAKDPQKVWNLFHRNAVRGSGKGKTVRSRELPPPKNYNQLSLPPLRGPLSARRRLQTRGELRDTYY